MECGSAGRARWRIANRGLSAAVVALVAGLVAALSLPPSGWWPLGMAGAALLAWRISDLPALARVTAGAAFGMGLFTPGLWWMTEFHLLGALIVMLVEAFFLALGVGLARGGRWAAVTLPAGLVLAEAARGVMPVGGVPLAGLGLGQAAGPLAGAARIGGELLVLALTVLAGAGLAQLARRRWAGSAVALGVAVAGAVLGAVSPDGGSGPTMATALVQGGGRRGLRAVETDARAVLDAQLAASARLRPPLDLVLWPEDVVEVEGTVRGTPEARVVADLARRTRATVVAGVIQSVGPDRFRNAAVAWSPDGEVVDRYDKVKRVPYGEYIPLRGLVSRLADVSAVPRDAIPGRGPGVLETPAARVGVAISYEVFFPRRARAAARAGASVLTVPTNASSYRTSQVPTQEVAAARLRAVESGRDLLQAAPTGYSAYVDNRGRVLARSTLGRRQVLERPATIRRGRTLYVRFGDWPVLAMAGAALVGAWVARWRVRSPGDGTT